VPTVPVKLLVKDLQPLFESKDVKARDKVKEIVVRWAKTTQEGWRADA
jgi:hypothetical protein